MSAIHLMTKVMSVLADGIKYYFTLFRRIFVILHRTYILFYVILILGGNVMSKKQTIITIVIVALAFTVGFFVGDSSAIHRVNKQISAKN